MCHRAGEKWDDLVDFWYGGPLTLVHGDSHLGNCFEYPSEDGPRVGLIDFQATHWSKGMRDVQYFMINSMEPDVLEANEEPLIRGYCEALAKHGVTLSFEEAWQQYRAFSFQSLLVGVVPLGLSALTERNETVLAITRRSAAAVERLGFREWLEGLD
jgi:aminoglycoside/choline kinase family phosphotransferase